MTHVTRCGEPNGEGDGADLQLCAPARQASSSTHTKGFDCAPRIGLPAPSLKRFSGEKLPLPWSRAFPLLVTAPLIHRNAYGSSTAPADTGSSERSSDSSRHRNGGSTEGSVSPYQPASPRRRGLPWRSGARTAGGKRSQERLACRPEERR